MSKKLKRANVRKSLEKIGNIEKFGLKKVRVVNIESNIPASIFIDGKYVGDTD